MTDETPKEKHEPKCPSCAVVGNAYIVSTNSIEKTGNDNPWFYTAHCSDCGYVYGVFPKHVTTKEEYVRPLKL